MSVCVSVPHFSMSNWTLVEKQKLLSILRVHGENLEMLANSFPEKSMEDILDVLGDYKKLADSKVRSTIGSESNTPIVMWIEILKKVNLEQNGEIQDVIPRALKYIAYFEKQEEKTTGKWSNCYKILADIMSGNHPQKMESEENALLKDCLSKLAESLQYQDLTATRNYLQGMESFHRLLNNKDATCLNPLAIPESLLGMRKPDYE